MSSEDAPCLSNASSAPVSSLSLMNELNRLMTMAKRLPFASSFPWIILAIA
jgi:hypothetical protein